ncbi:MAG: Nif3-like dinuclear metal center hexameric protein, partial [Bacteroidaceae bacterium]
GNGGGSGVIAKTECSVNARDFVAKVKSVFGVECAMCNAMLDRQINKVAICGGAGDFLLPRAIELGADAFITGEMHYHQYFGHEQEIQIIVVGHYQSEQYTMQLLERVLRPRFCNIKMYVTSVNTNPIIYV